jgi:type II secretory pathway pseudopilin PulG
MPIRTRYCGFTYVGLLILLSILGLTALVTVRLGEAMQQREAEQALLGVGVQWIDALDSYAMNTPPGKQPLPRQLEDLLRDPRTPALVRHLRRLPIDPVARSENWGVVRSPDNGGILGVYSLAKARPIKVAGFEPPFQDLEGKMSYQDWQFMGPIVEQTAVQ